MKGRRSRWDPAVGLAVGLLALTGACSSPPPLNSSRVPPPFAPSIASAEAGPITPVPAPVITDPARVELGRRLFFEPRLSHGDTLACASCHPLDHGGMDGLERARGLQGRSGERNTPTVFNAALNFRQFWDGRADSLESQIDGPVQNANEMGSSWPEIIAKLEKTPEYVAAFRAVYSEGVTAHGVRDAIAAFERTLVNTNSRFDRFLRGDEGALSTEERHGYELFRDLGCISCHQGANVGGNMFERLGIVRDFFGTARHPVETDLGRFTVTQRPQDRFVFRVPSLRLVGRTAPYLHDGSISTLAETVTTMAAYQLGREIGAADADAIVKFLGSLAGDQERIVHASSH